MKLITFLCAQGIIRDATRNGITAYNILEEFRGDPFPLFYPTIFNLAIFEKEDQDPEDSEAILQILNNDTLIFEIKLKISFQGHSRTRNITEVSGIVIPQPGRLIFQLTDFNKKLISTYSMIVIAPELKIKTA